MVSDQTNFLIVFFFSQQFVIKTPGLDLDSATACVYKFAFKKYVDPDPDSKNTDRKHSLRNTTYLLDEPVETGEHVENGREVSVDVLMLVQTVELWLHQQDVLREPKLQQEVVVHLFQKKR
jgi:hypothetical protein